jgi:type 1 glutamine amidotransferase
MRLAAPIDARFSAIDVRGGSAAEPVLWTRSHGRGRVCCCTLGHSAASVRHPSLRLIVARAIAWVSRTGEDARGA